MKNFNILGVDWKIQLLGRGGWGGGGVGGVWGGGGFWRGRGHNTPMHTMNSMQPGFQKPFSNNWNKHNVDKIFSSFSIAISIE